MKLVKSLILLLISITTISVCVSCGSDDDDDNSSSTSTSNSSTTGTGKATLQTYKSKYQTWESFTRDQYHSYLNAKNSSSNYTLMTTLSRNVLKGQRSMRDIRREAAAAGYTIYASYYETVSL